MVDSKRNTLPNGVISDKKAVSGNDVYLTINSTLQTELDSLMKDMQENTDATKACAAVMNAKTGALLAISNYPSFVLINVIFQIIMIHSSTKHLNVVRFSSHLYMRML